jgi:hypothetical protein
MVRRKREAILRYNAYEIEDSKAVESMLWVLERFIWREPDPILVHVILCELIDIYNYGREDVLEHTEAYELMPVE